MSFSQEQKALLGALVGLARALDESNIRRETLDIVASALRALAQGEDCQTALQAVREEKHRAVPDCSVCMNPCGRTAELAWADLDALEPELREAKYRLAEVLAVWGASKSAEKSSGEDWHLRLDQLMQGLFALGYEWFGLEELEERIQALKCV